MHEAIIIKHLKRDEKLVSLMRAIDFPESKLNENLYASLIVAIINQQLSVAAAATIHKRFLALFKNKIPSYNVLLNTQVEKLRNAGVSNQKAGYIKNIAQFGLEHTLDYHDLKELDDEALINYLTQIKGVGRWTVEMILMFNFNRLDIFPLDDTGIQNAIKKLYGIQSSGRELKAKMITQSALWIPYRSIACKYLWRWKDLK